MCEKHGEADFGCSLGEDTRLADYIRILHDFGTVKLARVTICTSYVNNEFEEKLIFYASDESELIEFLENNTVGKIPDEIPDELFGYFQLNSMDRKTNKPKNRLMKYFLIDERQI